MNHLENYQLWLRSQGLNGNTIRNYTADINKYLSTTSKDQIFNSQSISCHLHQLSDKKNSARYLASFNKLCQFAKDQNLIANNPVKKTRNLINLKPEIERYQNYLVKKNKSPKTIENYINDLNQFISWLETE